MSKTVLKTNGAPGAVGPYSQGVALDGWLWTSGQVALDPDTMELVSGGVEEQTHQVLKNLAHVLEAAGASFDSVLKTTVFLQRMDDFAAMNAIYAEHFAENRPARATVEVSKLPKGALVEVDCVAAVTR